MQRHFVRLRVPKFALLLNASVRLCCGMVMQIAEDARQLGTQRLRQLGGQNWGPQEHINCPLKEMNRVNESNYLQTSRLTCVNVAHLF